MRLRRGWPGRRGSDLALYALKVAWSKRSWTVQADYASRRAFKRDEPCAYEIIDAKTGDLVSRIRVGRLGGLRIES